MTESLQQSRRVSVIGAGGALGALVADAFDRAGWSVHPAGRRHLDHPDFRYVDAADESTVPAAVAGMDLVVTTVADPRLAVERHVLAHGGRLLSLSAGPADDLAVLRAEPVERRGAVVLNAGVAPGLTNLVAAALLAGHPEADEVEIVLTVTTKGSGGPASGDFAHRGLTSARRHATRWVDLPAPFGPRRVLGFAEADRGWLGAVAGDRTVNTFLCLSESSAARGMAALNRTGLIGRLPRSVLGSGRRTTVAGASREPVAHSVAVRRDGVRLGARLVRGSGDFRMAAASSVVFAEALCGREPCRSVRPGAWSLEDVVGLDQVADALVRSGIAVTGELYAAACR